MENGLKANTKKKFNQRLLEEVPDLKIGRKYMGLELWEGITLFGHMMISGAPLLGRFFSSLSLLLLQKRKKAGGRGQIHECERIKNRFLYAKSLVGQGISGFIQEYGKLFTLETGVFVRR